MEVTFMDLLPPLPNSQRRDSAIDLAKALAICAVLLVHCSADRFSLYDVGSALWLATALWGAVSRWAVPVFLLCSGALMNRPERELSLKKLFSRYFLRLVLALSFWAGSYELLRIVISRDSAPLTALLSQGAKHWLAGNTYYHLYYFYYAIALYLALPLTRLTARHASDTETRYLLVLWLAAGSLFPFLRSLWPFSKIASLSYYLLPSAFFCPGLGLLGWYLRRTPPTGWRRPLLLFAAGFAAVFWGTWQSSAATGSFNGLYLSAFHPFVLLMAIGIFRLVQAAPAAWTDSRAAALLSRASFCIYLIHPFFQWLVCPNFFAGLPPLWGVPLQAAVLLALSLASYLALRKIPLVERWLI